MSRQLELPRLGRLVCVLLLCLLLPACGGSKINKANYDKVKEGMTQKEVEAILGPGEEASSAGVSVPGKSVGGVSVPGVSLSGKALKWQEGTKVITVTFVNDKMTAKAQNGL